MKDPARRIFGASVPLLFLPAEYMGGQTGVAPLDYFINLFSRSPVVADVLAGRLQELNPAGAAIVRGWGSAIKKGNTIVVTGNNVPTLADMQASAATVKRPEPVLLQEIASFRPTLSLSGEAAAGEGPSFTRYLPQYGELVPLEGINDLPPLAIEDNAVGLEVINATISMMQAHGKTPEEICRVICSITNGLKAKYGAEVYRPREPAKAHFLRTPENPLKFAPWDISDQWKRLLVLGSRYGCSCGGPVAAREG